MKIACFILGIGKHQPCSNEPIGLTNPYSKKMGSIGLLGGVSLMNFVLNHRASVLVSQICDCLGELGIIRHEIGGSLILDAGIKAPGGLQAGLELARVCLADLAKVDLAPAELAGWRGPWVSVRSDHPVSACLGSQYAGMQVSAGKYFAMGSGPMRARLGTEPVLKELAIHEEVDVAVGVLETGKLPTVEVIEWLAGKLGVSPGMITLLVAPTTSIAGMVQVVARSLETALHQMHEIGFPLNAVVSGMGCAPLPCPHPDTITAIGRSNDAILYGSRVEIFLRTQPGQEDLVNSLGPKIPSSNSPAHGKPFAEIFREAGGDFYKIDPRLFAPAQVVFHDLTTGTSTVFGEPMMDLVRRSFGG